MNPLYKSDENGSKVEDTQYAMCVKSEECLKSSTGEVIEPTFGEYDGEFFIADKYTWCAQTDHKAEPK